MFQKKRLASILLIFTFVLSMFPMSIFAEEATDTSEVITPQFVVLFDNDTHARTNGDPIVAGLKKFLTDNGVDTLLLHAGDALHGQSIASLTEGAAIVDIMNADGYDALVPGNHEFNYGLDRLLELRDMANFPFLSSNVRYKADDSLVFEDSLVVESNGKKIGVFGLTTPETMVKTNPSNVEDIYISEPIDEATRVVQNLQEQGCDYIIALTHLGVDEETKPEWRSTGVAENVDGIDLIVDGHSHTYLEDGLMVNDTLIVSTGEYYEHIGELIVYTVGDDPVYKLQYLDTSFDEENPLPAALEGYVPDKTVEDLINTLNTAVESVTSEVIGHTDFTLDGEREQVRTHETNLTTLLVNALLDATGADLAITNGGNTRASIEAGDITVGDIISTWPFGNMAVTIEVSGQEFLDMIEFGIDAYPETAGKMPHIGGVKVEFDPTLPAGNRVVSIKNEDGTDFDLDKTYTLVTNEFMANGGDGYYEFADKEIQEYFSLQSDLVINYIQAGNEIPEFPAGRLVAVEPEVDPVPPIDPNDVDTVTPEVDPVKPLDPNDVDTVTPEVDPVPPTTEVDPDFDQDISVDPDYDLDVEDAVLYTVESGDYLIKIAAKYDVNWRSIAEINGLSDPYIIYPGQVLKIK